MNKKVIPVVAGVIVKTNGITEVLLRYRDKDEAPEAEQNWELPGGSIKYGETPEKALEREIREELGHNVTVKGVLYAQSNIYSSKKHYLVLYYECHIWPQFTPVNCHWYRLNDIEELPTLPGTREAIRALQSVRR